MARYLFLLAKTKDRKFKQKTEGKKEKTEEAHLPGPPRPNSPLQPAQPAKLFCRLPPRAPKQLAGAAEHAVDATSTPSSFQAAPGRQRAPRRRPRLPLSLSPIAASSRALPWFSPSSPRASAAHRRENPQPTATRTRETVSPGRSVFDFVDLEELAS